MVCREDAYTVVYGCFKPFSVYLVSFQQHLCDTKSSTLMDLRPHLYLEFGACFYFFDLTVDTSDVLAKHYHRFFGSQRRQETSWFCLTVAVSLLCSVAIPVPVKGFLPPHW